jgi:hypothetical protein
MKTVQQWTTKVNAFDFLATAAVQQLAAPPDDKINMFLFLVLPFIFHHPYIQFD